MKSETIMVPIDGSKFAETAVPVALGLGRRLGARVKLVSAIYELEVITVEQAPVYGAPSVLTEQDVEDQTDQYLDTLIDRIHQVTDLEVTKEIVHGPIATSLQDYADARAPGLIIMSTHGRGPLSRLWLGSIADRLVRHVHTPVILVRPNEALDVDLRDWQPYRRIVVALDGSELAEQSLDMAGELAKATGATLVLFRAVVPPFPVQSSYLPDAAAATHKALEGGKEEAEEYLARLADRISDGQLTVERHVLVGHPPAFGILNYASESGADLIALATHGRGGVVRAVLGSVADKVIRGAQIPVLVTRPT
jgi:nucleotide-binding universal stress UspA family protein